MYADNYILDILDQGLSSQVFFHMYALKTIDTLDISYQVIKLY